MVSEGLRLGGTLAGSSACCFPALYLVPSHGAYSDDGDCQALKADILLVFGIKSDTKDGTACLEVRERLVPLCACACAQYVSLKKRTSLIAGVFGYRRSHR